MLQTIVISFEDINAITVDVKAMLKGHPMLAETAGTGYYEGHQEATRILMYQIPSAKLDGLRTRLARIAKANNQAAIGLTTADAISTLVFAK